MDFVAKIFVLKNKLVLENCKKEINNVLYPAGKTEKSFRIGTVVIGAENIAISEEAISMLKNVIRYSKHTGDDISDLDIYKTNDGRVVFGWLGKNKRVFDPEKLEDVVIGCGEGVPDLSLLNNLHIEKNDFLIKHDFNSLSLDNNMSK